jgi:CheY-like chemotaxis protein
MTMASAAGAVAATAARIPWRLCVLIVDDDEGDAYLIRHVLSRHPAVGRILHAWDGEQAQAMIFGGGLRPDLAFIDLHMPRVDGFELMSALTGLDGVDFPMMILTSSIAPIDMVRSRLQGARRFITKPETTRQLEIELGSAVDLVHAGGIAAG